MKWSEGFINKIICGDCLEVMKGMPNNSIDTIITDPPYGLEFMGKEWDRLSGKGRYQKGGVWQEVEGYSPPAYKGGNEAQKFHYRWAIEALRIAKPGSTLLCFGGTRTYHRLACAIEDAGWIIKDCIVWIYGSGFPKATDISKQMQKQSGKKPKVIGRNPNSREKCDKSNTLYESGTVGKTDYITEPTDKNATLWNGWKSHGLKPSYEPILVCMKPNEGSYANNALKWGVAGLNIDGGRIGFEEGGTVASNPRLRVERGCKTETGDRIFCQGKLGKKNTMVENVKKGGRFPANVILDEESAGLLDEQAPKTGAFAKVKSGHSGKSKGIYHDYKQRGDDGETFYSDGLQGTSRFFYCAKASKSERNRGLIWMENVKGGTYQFRQDGGLDGKIPIKTNHHPTVKPLALMKYLVRLTLMPNINQIYLDPFCGSGTTLIACKELKRDYIGIDNQPEYCEIARRRVNAIPEPLF